MRPIAYGIIAFFGGGTLWFLFSVLAALESLTGEAGGSMVAMYIFGAIFFFSLPLAIIAEIVRWLRKRKTE